MIWTKQCVRRLGLSSQGRGKKGSGGGQEIPEERRRGPGAVGRSRGGEEVPSFTPREKVNKAHVAAENRSGGYDFNVVGRPTKALSKGNGAV